MTGESAPRHAFDSAQRNALARMVGRCRERLKIDLMDQLRRLGFQDDGSVLDLDKIAGLDESERAAGRELRALLDHFVSAEISPPGPRSAGISRAAGYDRLVRELGFTTFNRLVALRMAEERGIIVPSVSGGFDTDVIVVGSGISGLACAWGLQQRGIGVVLLEAAPQAGGTISTSREQGCLFESGPNSALDTTPLIATNWFTR